METQKSILSWSIATFGKSSAQAKAVRMNVEVAELLGDLQRLADSKNAPWPARKKLQKAAMVECADVAIMLMQVVEQLGGDLDTLVDEKMKVNRARRWGKTEDGRGQHIEEPKSAPCLFTYRGVEIPPNMMGRRAADAILALPIPDAERKAFQQARVTSDPPWKRCFGDTFRSESAEMFMKLDCWYIVSDSGGHLCATSFPTPEDAVDHTFSAEFFRAHGHVTVGVPRWLGPSEGWENFGDFAAPIVLGRHVWEFFDAYPLSSLTGEPQS